MTRGKCAFRADEYKDFFLPRYRRDPVLFALECLGVRAGGWQPGFLRLLCEGMGTPRGAHLALASGHETGKTYISCAAMLWGLCVIPDCHIYCTSVTADHLKTRLWGYMRRMAMESPLSNWLDIDSEKVVFRHVPGNFIKAQSWSKDNPQSWAGDHCHSSWAVFDECSDIHDSIFDAWSGTATKKNSVTIMMGQPRLRTGRLFDAFHKDKEYWTRLCLSSIESPFASRQFIEDAKKKHGEDSDYYRIRVLGQFPKADSSQLFPDAKEKALEDFEPGGPPDCAGLDIAAGGSDKTTLFMRRGDSVVALEKFDSGDHVALAEAISGSLARRGCHELAADTIGYGYGLVKMLSAKKDLNVSPVNGSQNAVNRREYHNRRSEAYGRLAKAWKGLRFLRGGVRKEDFDDLCRQLESIRIFYDREMRVCVLPKAEIKEELGESPDLADALAYSFMARSAPPPAERQKRISLIRQIQLNSNPYRR